MLGLKWVNVCGRLSMVLLSTRTGGGAKAWR
jgi:hypothetical protein